jgi:hypothetical protein
VGALGLPEELSFGSKKIKTLFGFPDSVLGDHVERAYQALALNETRADFVPFFIMPRRLRVLIRLQNSNKFHLSEEGIKKNQVLKQVQWMSPLPCKLLTLFRSVGSLVSTSITSSVTVVDIPNQGSHSDVGELDFYGFPGIFTLSADWWRL